MSDDGAVNPFASPQAPSAQPMQVVRQRVVAAYKSARFRALFVWGALGLWVAASALNFAWGSRQQGIWQSYSKGPITPDSPELMEQYAIHLGLRVTLMLILAAVLCIVSVCYLVWMWLAYRNLYALGATKLRQSPGWAVAFYILPFVNFFKPYEGMNDLVRGSDPRGLNYDDGMGNSRRALVMSWWIVMLLDAVLLRMTSNVTWEKPQVQDLVNDSTGVMVQAGFSFFAIAFMAYMVWRIDRHQAARAHVIEQLPRDEYSYAYEEAAAVMPTIAPIAASVAPTPAVAVTATPQPAPQVAPTVAPKPTPQVAPKPTPQIAPKPQPVVTAAPVRPAPVAPVNAPAPKPVAVPAPAPAAPIAATKPAPAPNPPVAAEPPAEVPPAAPPPVKTPPVSKPPFRPNYNFKK